MVTVGIIGASGFTGAPLSKNPLTHSFTVPSPPTAMISSLLSRKDVRVKVVASPGAVVVRLETNYR